MENKMESYNHAQFLSSLIQITSFIANRIRYLLSTNEIDKADALLDVMSNFTLLQSIALNDNKLQDLKFFQSLLNLLSYSELNELKHVINSTIAMMEIRKDSSH